MTMDDGAGPSGHGPSTVQVVENTFQLGPHTDQKFIPTTIKQSVQSVLEERLEGVAYEADKAKDLAKQLSQACQDRVRELGIPRHKIVVQVSLFENAGQGMHVASRCLWDPETDNYATITIRNATIVAVAMIFGCYYE